MGEHYVKYEQLLRKNQTLQARIEEMGADMTFVQSCLAEAHGVFQGDSYGGVFVVKCEGAYHREQWDHRKAHFIESPQTFVRDALEVATRWTDTNTPPQEGN